MENEFYRHYKDRVVPALRERHKYKNVHQIPRVHKVVINTSVGSQPDIKQALDEAKMELALITGQHRLLCYNCDHRANGRGDHIALERTGNAFFRSREKARHGESVRRRTG